MTKAKTGIGLLVIGALGVVFGDIGTSPLYAMKAIFGEQSLVGLAITEANVWGIVSLIFWSITIIVSIKYILFVLRANNKGEGGVLALVALLMRTKLGKRRKSLLVLLGLIGVSLFYGDSIITPAISVLSAVEGLQVIENDFSRYVIPITLALLAFLFFMQRYGTALIGKLFGPIMIIWFAVLAAGGISHIAQNPDIISALSPLYALQFTADNPLIAFTAMGAVILVVTGAEALYADMGHFGRKPIARGWFFFVFPALALNYMGQGALLLSSPDTASNSFFMLYPEALRLSVIILATVATLIAAQSVISGAFSLTRQAIQLGFLPRIRTIYTSNKTSGQIYQPVVCGIMFVLVSSLVIAFGSSERLAGAYGVAVSATLTIDALLFLYVMRYVWKSKLASVITLGIIFLSLDLIFVAATAQKVLHGGAVPLTIALGLCIVLTTWRAGQRIITKEREKREGELEEFVQNLQTQAIVRTPGTGIFVGHHKELAPLALHAAVENFQELPQKTIIISVITSRDAHVPENKRYVFNSLGNDLDNISHLTIKFGYHDSQNIPKALLAAQSISPELVFDPQSANYFVSLASITPTKRHNLARWRKSLYKTLSKNALSPTDYYHLPIHKTVEVRSLIEL